MKTISFSFVILLFSSWLFCQNENNDVKKQLDELRSRIKNLEKENEILKAENRWNDSIVYCDLRNDIFYACTNLPQLDFDFKRTAEKIAVTGLFTKLMQANNPTSDILGFRFTEVIFNASEKHFRYILKDVQDRKRFSQVISKIIDNPVISTLANTNPVTSVVGAIISTIAGFTTSKVNLEKEGGRIEDVTVVQEDIFDQGNISAFRDDLQVYIDFYDALIIASSDYLAGLEELNAKYAYLVQSVDDYKAELYSAIEVRENNMLIRLSKILPDPAIRGIDFKAISDDPVIRTSHRMAGKYPLLQLAVNDFKKDYNSLLFKYLNTYTSTLETALEFPDADIDKSKINDLIADINVFIRNQKSTDQDGPDAFE
jgi:hypothetical protein